MDAVFLLDKPTGMTSFEAVRKCRNICHEKKAGHTGTLDPNASGLMIILMGKYTKLAPYCVKDHKHYQATFSCGSLYDTGDIWGKCIQEKAYQDHDEQELKMIAKSFIGVSKQVPPMYSAIKMNGKKLYELARQGIEVERKERDIFIDKLEVKRISANNYALDAIVSSGTYIRTLIEDFCAKLDELGTMTSLKRVGIEHLDVKDALSFAMIEDEMKITSPISVVSKEYQLVEMPELEKDILHGKKLSLSGLSDKVIFIKGNELLAAYERQDDIYRCQRGLY